MPTESSMYMSFCVCNIVHKHMQNEITNSCKQGNKKSDYNDNMHSRESARKIRLCFHRSSSYITHKTPGICTLGHKTHAIRDTLDENG